MSADVSPYERRPDPAARALQPIRVVGGIGARFEAESPETRLKSLSERGGYRLRFPATHASHVEAVQINTGGGVVGGDRLATEIDVGAGADVVYATQAAERIYRSIGPASEIDTRIAVAAGARLDWLPQETILFSGARLKRRYEIDVAHSSRLMMVETVVYGRIASGETMKEGLLHDVWRVRRSDRLILAEAVRLDGDISELLARPALAAGGRATAFLLYVAPDAGDMLTSVRDALAVAGSVAGASAWNGLLVARFLGPKPEVVRRDISHVARLLGRRPLPRVWTM